MKELILKTEKDVVDFLKCVCKSEQYVFEETCSYKEYAIDSRSLQSYLNDPDNYVKPSKPLNMTEVIQPLKVNLVKRDDLLTKISKKLLQESVSTEKRIKKENSILEKIKRILKSK